MSVTKVEMTDISSQFAVAWYLATNGVQIVVISFGRVFDGCFSNEYIKDHIFDLRGKNIWEYDWSSQLYTHAIRTQDSRSRHSIAIWSMIGR